MFNDNIPENFFNITLSQQGASTLLKLQKIVRWLFILVIVASVMLLINIGMKHRLYMRYTINNWFTLFQLKIYPVVEVVILAIGFVQNYYFLRFVNAGKKSIELQQPDQFNESFTWLLKAGVVAGILVILQMIIVCITLYGDLELLRALH